MGKKKKKKKKSTKEIDIKTISIQALVDLVVGVLVAIIAKYII